MTCFKQLPFNSTLIFELFIHLIFGEKLLFAVVEGLIFSFDNRLDFHSTIESVRTDGIMKVLKIGSNIKKFCDPSFPK